MSTPLERRESIGAGVGAFIAPTLYLALPCDALILLLSNTVEYDPSHPFPWGMYAFIHIVAVLAGAVAGRRAFNEWKDNEPYRRAVRDARAGRGGF
jgi:hypothetical protein